MSKCAEVSSAKRHLYVFGQGEANIDYCIYRCWVVLHIVLHKMSSTLLF